VPVTVNCCDPPMVILAVAGDIAIEVSAALAVPVVVVVPVLEDAPVVF